MEINWMEVLAYVGLGFLGKDLAPQSCGCHKLLVPRVEVNVGPLQMLQYVVNHAVFDGSVE